MKKLILFISILTTVFAAKAQDIHFSQFHAAPVLLNPALTGAFGGEARFIANYRSQWQEVPVPYVTQAFSAETKIQTKRIGSFFGIGLSLANDTAGDLDFRTSTSVLSLSYQQFMGSLRSRKGDLYLRVGFQAGRFQQQFDPSKIRFEQGEEMDLLSQNISMMDYSTGVVLSYVEKNLILHGGIALSHLNNPDVTFFNRSSNAEIGTYMRDDSEFLFKKIAFHIGADITIQKGKYSILPDFQYARQAVHQELLLGSYFRFNRLFAKGSNQQNPVYWNIGAWLRYGDAIVLATKFDFSNSFSLGISYDSTVSQAMYANNSFGAIELSMTYTIQSKRTENAPSQSGGIRRKGDCPFGPLRPNYENPWYRQKGLAR